MQEVTVTKVVSDDQRVEIENGKIVVYFNKYSHEEFDSVVDAVTRLGVGMALVVAASKKHKAKLADQNPNGSDDPVDLSDIPF